MYQPRRVTLKDIAQATDYSINTVSKALKDSPSISSATKERIRASAKEMGYIGDHLASSMRSGVTKTIAVIVGDISNPHFAILVKEVETKARESGYSIMVLNSDETAELEREAVMLALSKKVDGIIICPTQQSIDNVLQIERAGVPVVLFGRHFDELPTSCVLSDNVRGGELAAEHLLSLGHRRICVLNAPAYISCARERLEGYRRAHAACGVHIDPSLEYTLPLRAEPQQSKLRDILKRPNFTAIFAFNDVIAWESVSILQSYGMDVPKDISVVGFDDLLSKLQFPFQLTSIHTSKRVMAQETLKLLIEQIEASGSRPRMIVKKVIDTSIVVRKSTANI